jgi:hypothetical protein
MNLVRYKANFRGILKIRGSSEVDEDLERRAHLVAEAAGSLYGTIAGDDAKLPPPSKVTFDVLQESSDTNEPRARVAVIMRNPHAIGIERDHRILGTAISAARD